MRITNLTRGTLVAASATEAHRFTQKLLGLMFQARLPDSGALVIHTNWVHTFWMRFPLDLIYVNRERRVVGLQEAMPPNRIGKPFWSAQSVIELSAGVIESSQTQLGDQLEFS